MPYFKNASSEQKFKKELAIWAKVKYENLQDEGDNSEHCNVSLEKHTKPKRSGRIQETLGKFPKQKEVKWLEDNLGGKQVETLQKEEMFKSNLQVIMMGKSMVAVTKNQNGLVEPSSLICSGKGNTELSTAQRSYEDASNVPKCDSKVQATDVHNPCELGCADSNKLKCKPAITAAAKTAKAVRLEPRLKPVKKDWGSCSRKLNGETSMSRNAANDKYLLQTANSSELTSRKQGSHFAVYSSEKLSCFSSASDVTSSVNGRFQSFEAMDKEFYELIGQLETGYVESPATQCADQENSNAVIGAFDDRESLSPILFSAPDVEGSGIAWKGSPVTDTSDKEEVSVSDSLNRSVLLHDSGPDALVKDGAGGTVGNSAASSGVLAKHEHVSTDQCSASSYNLKELRADPIPQLSEQHLVVVPHPVLRPNFDKTIAPSINAANMSVKGVSQRPHGFGLSDATVSHQVPLQESLLDQSSNQTVDGESILNLEKVQHDMSLSLTVRNEDIISMCGTQLKLGERFAQQATNVPRDLSRQPNASGIDCAPWSSDNHQIEKPEDKLKMHHFCINEPPIKLSCSHKVKSRFIHTPSRMYPSQTSQSLVQHASQISCKLDAKYEPDEPGKVEENRLSVIAEKIIDELELENDVIKEKKFSKLQNLVGKLFESATPDFNEEVKGNQIELRNSLTRYQLLPAPPKFDIPPDVVKAQLLPEYHGALFAKKELLLSKDLERSHQDSICNETMVDVDQEEQEYRERLLKREHHSTIDLTTSDIDDVGDPFSIDHGSVSECGDSDGAEVPERFETVLEMRRKFINARPDTADSFLKARRHSFPMRRSQSQPSFMRDSAGDIKAFETNYHQAMEEVKKHSLKADRLRSNAVQELTTNVLDVNFAASSSSLVETGTRVKEAKNPELSYKQYACIGEELKGKILEQLNSSCSVITRSCSVEAMNIAAVFKAKSRGRSISESDFSKSFEDKIASGYNGSPEGLNDWIKEKYWYHWFDEVYPPSHVGDDVEGDEFSTSDGNDGRCSAVVTPVDVSLMRGDTANSGNTNVLSAIKEEISRLTCHIDKSTIGSALYGFHLCRRGACYRKIGDLRNSLRDLNRALELEPRLLDAYWHRHLIHLVEGNTSQALADLNYILQFNPSHVNALRSRAELFYRKGDLTTAIANYSQAIKASPKDPELYSKRACLLEERGDTILAIEDYREMTLLQPNGTDGLMKIGLYHYNMKSWMACISDFTALLARDPLHAEAYSYRGRANAELLQFREAIADLSVAVNLNPADHIAFHTRGCLLRKLLPKQALQDLSVSLLLCSSKENVSSFLHRAILYSELNRFPEAVKDFEAAVRLVEKLSPAHVNLGLIEMIQNRNPAGAIRRFNIALRLNPTYTRAYICRAAAHEMMHNIDAAIKDHTRAIHMCPDSIDYRTARGRLLVFKNMYDLASFHIRQCAEMTSGRSSTPIQQAAVFSFLKRHDQAIRVLEAATRSRPVAHLFTLLGKVKLKAGLYRQAIESLKESLNILKPWSPKMNWPIEAADVFFNIGLCHMELGNYPAALGDFSSAIRVDPEFSKAYYQRGLVKIKLNNSKAVHDFNKALVWNPKFYQAYLARAAYYGAKKRYAKAIMNCNEAARLQENSARAYTYRGALKCFIRAYRFAVRDLSRAIQIDHNCQLAYFNRAVCYHELKHYFKAIKDYSIVLMSDSKFYMKALINRALLYLEIDDIPNALHDFLLASKEQPRDLKIVHAIGYCYHRLGMLDHAVKAYSSALTADRYSIDSLLGRGNVLMDYQNNAATTMGRRDYVRALHLDPLCLQARVNLAFYLQAQGRFMDAWNMFSRTIDMDESNWRALEGRAIVSLQMGNTFGALVDINNAIKVQKSAELLTNRGVINQFLGDLVNAMRDYRAAVQYDRSYSLAFYNMGNICFAQRRYKEAAAHYDQVLGWDCEDESALGNRALAKAMLNDRSGAFADFQKAIEMSPYSAHLYYNRGNLYADCGMLIEAEQDFSRALSLKPGDALVYKRRADVRGKLGLRRDALKDYRTAILLQTTRRAAYHASCSLQKAPVLVS